MSVVATLITILKEAMRKSYLKSRVVGDNIVDTMLNINTVSLPTSIKRCSRFNDFSIYQGLPYLELWKYVNSVKPSRKDVVFDIGCGAGRVLCAFARRPVEKCVGIEVSKELVVIARQNAESLRGRKAPIEIVVCDAIDADYSEGTIYCLFNPFGAETLELVIRRIHHSLKESPRHIRIAYFNSVHENILQGCGWLRCYKRKKGRVVRRDLGTVSLWTNSELNV